MTYLFGIGYVKNQISDQAIELFKKIKCPDDVLRILLFNACAQVGTRDALDFSREVFSKMTKSSQLNHRVLPSLLDTAVKCNDIEYAQSLFDKSGEKTLSMYGIMMNGYNRINEPWKTLSLFNQMKIDRIEINHIISTCVIKALSRIGDYSLSQTIVDQIPKHCFIDNQIDNVLIDMWVGLIEMSFFFIYFI